MKDLLSIFLPIQLLIVSSAALCSQVQSLIEFDVNDPGVEAVYVDSGDQVIEVIRLDGVLASKSYLEDVNGQLLPHGERRTWYASGNIRTVENYWKGCLSGVFVKYYESGAVERRDNYISGRFIAGACYDESGQEIDHCRYYTDVGLPGGDLEGYMRYMMARIKYPRVARVNGEQGTVWVSFLVNRDGRVTNTEILNSVSQSIDRQVLKVLEKQTRFKPATLEGVPVAARMVLPFHFKLTSE